MRGPRPASIVLFERVFVAMILVQIAYVTTNWLEPGGWLSRLPDLTPYQRGYVIVMSGGGTLMYLALLYFAARRASQTALALISLTAVLRAYGFWGILGLRQFQLDRATALATAALCLHLLAVFLLFRPDSRRWFRGESRTDPTIFN